MNLESKIEAILFFKNEPVSVSELVKLAGGKPDEVNGALVNLRAFYKDRGMVVISDGEFVSFGTHPDQSEMILNLQKEELVRELSRASLETLAVILYRGPISRREIDHLRGVNSGFILRALLIRGLIERADSSANLGSVAAGRSYSYKAALKLLEYLGVTRLQDLPEYEKILGGINEFVKTTPIEQG